MYVRFYQLTWLTWHFLILSLFSPRLVFVLFNICMVAFGGWLGWLAIFKTLAIFAKAYFQICMVAFARWLGDLILSQFLKGLFSNFHFLYRMGMCVFSGWLGWLAIFEALAVLSKASFWICMCAFVGWIGWLDIFESLAIFAKAIFITVQYVYGRFC